MSNPESPTGSSVSSTAAPSSVVPTSANSSSPTSAQSVPSEVAAKEVKDIIQFEDFAKVQLRVGQIVEASAMEKSEKLLRLKVDLGETEGPRQILAGIAKHYKAEDLVGRKVAVVSNLAPRKMMGLESSGMLLAASDESGYLELLNPGAALKPGSRIS
jgi:methionyl-tRNA synthetase